MSVSSHSVWVCVSLSLLLTSSDTSPSPGTQREKAERGWRSCNPGEHHANDSSHPREKTHSASPPSSQSLVLCACTSRRCSAAPLLGSSHRSRPHATSGQSWVLGLAHFSPVSAPHPAPLSFSHCRHTRASSGLISVLLCFSSSSSPVSAAQPPAVCSTQNAHTHARSSLVRHASTPLALLTRL